MSNLSQEYLRAVFWQLINYQIDPNSFAPLISVLQSSSFGGRLVSIQTEPIKLLFGEIWLYVSLDRLDMMSKYVEFRRSNSLTLFLDIFDIWLEMLIVVGSQNLEGQALVARLNEYVSRIDEGFTLNQGLYPEFESAVRFLLPELVIVS